MTEFLFLAACWLVCGFLSAGITFAYFQDKYPTLKDDAHVDAGFSALIGLIGGPFALVIVFFLSGFCKHGIRWWRKS